MLVEFSERAVKKVVEKRKGTMNKRLMLMAMIVFFFCFYDLGIEVFKGLISVVGVSICRRYR